MSLKQMRFQVTSKLIEIIIPHWWHIKIQLVHLRTWTWTRLGLGCCSTWYKFVLPYTSPWCPSPGTSPSPGLPGLRRPLPSGMCSKRQPVWVTCQQLYPASCVFCFNAPEQVVTSACCRQCFRLHSLGVHCHWLYEWFSQFHRCGTYSVLSRSPSYAFA